jgi:hypothetical protein
VSTIYLKAKMHLTCRLYRLGLVSQAQAFKSELDYYLRD